jgi:hypothetical protein
MISVEKITMCLFRCHLLFSFSVQSSGVAPWSNDKANANAGTARALWPPLRPPTAPPAMMGCDPRQVTRSGKLHAALLAVLHRAVHRRRPPPEHVLALAVFLLEVAVDVEKEANITGKNQMVIYALARSQSQFI